MKGNRPDAPGVLSEPKLQPTRNAAAPPARQELAVIDSPTGFSTLELQGDEALLQALLNGAHVENAAVVAGMSERTAYRRLADPAFRQRVEAGREAIRESILARLTEAAGDAVSRLWELTEHEDPMVRVKAAKAILDGMVKVQAGLPKTKTTVRYSVEQARTD